MNVVDTLIYLHTDHLGSVSVATGASGQVVSQQEYDPWGKVRTGGIGIGQTTLNYTGQRLDGTGLLYYHARYYDPGLARFISPDSIVPGASLGAGGALGTVGQEQNSLLTVDFHEGTLLSGLNNDNALILQKGYWFQLSGQDRRQRQRQAREPWGPANPQALSRYAYVLGNPLRYRDPSGYSHQPMYRWLLTYSEAAELYVALRDEIIPQIVAYRNALARGTADASTIMATLLNIIATVVKNAKVAAVLQGMAGILGLSGVSGSELIDRLDELIRLYTWVRNQTGDYYHNWSSYALQYGAECVPPMEIWLLYGIGEQGGRTTIVYFFEAYIPGDLENVRNRRNYTLDPKYWSSFVRYIDEETHGRHY